MNTRYQIYWNMCHLQYTKLHSTTYTFHVILSTDTERGGGFTNILLWEILHFKCVRNFPLNSQAAVQNKLVSKFLHLGASPPCQHFSIHQCMALLKRKRGHSACT